MPRLTRHQTYVPTFWLAVVALFCWAGQASATRTALPYTCHWFMTSVPISIVADVDAPASVVVGTPMSLNGTADATLPESATSVIRDQLWAASVEGAGTLSATVGGQPVSIAMSFARTPLPADGSLTIHATMSAAYPITATTPGEIRATVGSVQGTLTFYDASGAQTFVPLDGTCDLDAGASSTVQTIAVTAVPPAPAPAPAPVAVQTTTSLRVQPATIAFGRRALLTAQVAASQRNPTGRVEFRAAGRTTVAAVVNGVASARVSSLPVGTTTVTATYVSDSTAFTGSGASARVRVVRAPVSIRSGVVFVADGHRLTVRTRVVATTGAPVRGTRVTVVLRRGALVIATANRTVGADGSARVVFNGIRTAGRYTVLTRVSRSRTLAGATRVVGVRALWPRPSVTG